MIVSEAVVVAQFTCSSSQTLNTMIIWMRICLRYVILYIFENYTKKYKEMEKKNSSFVRMNRKIQKYYVVTDSRMPQNSILSVY